MAFVPFTGVDALLAEHAAALPQPDQLCGPFAARLAVVALTGRSRSAEPVPDVTAFARAAGSAIWPHDLPGARPPGVPPRTDLWPGLDRAADERSAGTSAAGTGRAVEQLSDGTLAAVPVSGTWTPDRLRVLLDGLTGMPVLPVANVDTGRFVSSHAPSDALQGYLATGADGALPRADWSAGHFVVLYGREDGPGGTLLALADSYPQLGESGRHRQPLPRVATALARERRRTGGLMLVTAAGHRETAGVAVRAAGLEVEWWDNGTPQRPR
ncbi:MULTISPECIES: DUF6885 family protein [Pseudonocardia]|uniref:Peptidase C39-like domain-containing protein n=2 Tax=Pseudonocardia TaxID=1847 RepID=A0A1Y2N2R4_PSEAH|nr:MULTISPECIES: hypothetical protein [Pseudonocardia]OSY41481.1 hypothetical protein BG845_01972 [Pseudonocardia autotrophica]TDN71437.1 hypothetical protein C8E95_0468 [Pseudonocardia autotrophica]BBG02113.1 hypothetical protein Pdca_33220 [Pseudonocardia autotrophica]GEC24127.1 hypothetical protein PSA01_11560 [Pseudonocardia saturnea]